jgi:hypothetical protein
MPKQADENKNKKRGLKVVAFAGALVLAGGVAFAYWTAGGSGTGSATTGDVSAVTVVQTSAITGLAPGGSAQTLSGTFNNPNTGPVYVGTVNVEITDVTDTNGDSLGTACDADDYTLSATSFVKGAEVLADDSSTWTGPTIAFNNKATNQDACKGAVVHLGYTVV